MSRALTDLGGWKVAAEDFLAAVLQTTAQPVWVVDAEGLIRFANPAAIAALGYDGADELLAAMQADDEFGRALAVALARPHRDDTGPPRLAEAQLAE